MHTLLFGTRPCGRGRKRRGREAKLPPPSGEKGRKLAGSLAPGAERPQPSLNQLKVLNRSPIYKALKVSEVLSLKSIQKQDWPVGTGPLPGGQAAGRPGGRVAGRPGGQGARRPSGEAVRRPDGRAWAGQAGRAGRRATNHEARNPDVCARTTDAKHETAINNKTAGRQASGRADGFFWLWAVAVSCQNFNA